VFRHHTGLRWPEVRARAEAFADPIDAYDVRLLPELEGIAEGAAVDAEDVLALNVRTEVMFGMRRPECTALCAPAGADTPGTLLAQTWDWKPGARGTCVLLVEAPHDAPPSVTFVEAGLLAKCGMNEAGIGVAANALTSTLDLGTPGVPFHAILRRILTSSSFDEALDAVRSPRRASSANYLVASREGRAADLEALPGGPELVAVDEGMRLAHANHFLRRPPSGARDLERFASGTTSVARQEAADRAIAGARSVEDLLATLRDHDAPVCRHASPDDPPEEADETIAAVAMDLAAGALWITQGPPCTAEVERLELGSLLSQAA
jgi:isopenicillin-N N-acyltransferase-like protein